MLFNPDTGDQLVIALSLLIMPVLVFSLIKRSLKPLFGALFALFIAYFLVQPLMGLIVGNYPLEPWFDQFLHGTYIYGVYYGPVDVLTAVVCVLAVVGGALWRGTLWEMARRSLQPKV